MRCKIGWVVLLSHLVDWYLIDVDLLFPTTGLQPLNNTITLNKERLHFLPNTIAPPLTTSSLAPSLLAGRGLGVGFYA
ncbi:hypothetical protein [Scytonema sp. PRP1]|uniref:hypothetical protein n=1 Tax=Scytonema sp. PRP1 TaxID=3120513 RepID=UPI002FD44609